MKLTINLLSAPLNSSFARIILIDRGVSQRRRKRILQLVERRIRGTKETLMIKNYDGQENVRSKTYKIKTDINR